MKVITARPRGTTVRLPATTTVTIARRAITPARIDNELMIVDS